METKNIYTKLLSFQSKVETIKKDGKNTFFKNAKGNASSYATLPNILAEVKPLLTELKLVLTQPIVDNSVSTCIIDSESGEKICSAITLPSGLNAQQTGSAITYYRRYTLSSLLSLEIDEDDDGNKASQKVEIKPKAKKELTENMPEFLKAKDFIQTGQGTIEDIEKKYNVSFEISKLLTGN